MLTHFSKLAAATALLSFSYAMLAPSSGILWGQAKQPQYKDTAESDLGTAISKETDPTKKLALLDTWKQKYPESDLKTARLAIYITTYQQLGQGENMWKTAQELLGLEPKNFGGLYWSTLLVMSLGNTTPERLAAGEKAALGLLDELPTAMGSDKKPPNVADAAWKQQRDTIELEAVKALGWIEMTRKNNEKSETYFVRYLKTNPNDAGVSQLLGRVMALQGKPDKSLQALFHIARAAFLTGQGALPEAGKKPLQAYIEKQYTSYHGSKDGLDELTALAVKSPFPPEGFTIKSAAEIEEEQRLKMVAENPKLAAWLAIKKELRGPGGQAYFEGMKGAKLPQVKGYVISQAPPARPKTVQIGVANKDNAEITLRFETPLPNAAEPGTEIDVAGVVAEFVQDPFMLTIDVDRDVKEDFVGWPAAPKGRGVAAPKAGAGKAAPKK